MFSLRSIFVEVFLLSIVIAGGFLIVLIGEERCHYTLDVVQGLLRSPESLLLNLHAAMEIIVLLSAILIDTNSFWTELMMLEKA